MAEDPTNCRGGRASRLIWRRGRSRSSGLHQPPAGRDRACLAAIEARRSAARRGGSAVQEGLSGAAMRFCSQCGAPVVCAGPRATRVRAPRLHGVRQSTTSIQDRVGAVAAGRTACCAAGRSSPAPGSGGAGRLPGARARAPREGARREAGEEAGARIELTGLLVSTTWCASPRSSCSMGRACSISHLAAGPETRELDSVRLARHPGRAGVPERTLGAAPGARARDQGGAYLPALGP
jgi:hypothetical protein